MFKMTKIEREREREKTFKSQLLALIVILFPNGTLLRMCHFKAFWLLPTTLNKFHWVAINVSGKYKELFRLSKT